MIIATDMSDRIYKANPTHTAGDYSQASGVYKITTTFKADELIGRPLLEFQIDQIILEQTGGIDPLPMVKTKRKEAINIACRNQIIAGFESSALGTPHQYPFKEEDQSNLMSTFMLAKEFNVSKVFKCWDAAGVDDYRLHTVAQLTQVGQDAETHKMTALIKARTLKAQINAATTAAEVEGIVW